MDGAQTEAAIQRGLAFASGKRHFMFFNEFS
jgi:hypothetical protein